MRRLVAILLVLLAGPGTAQEAAVRFVAVDVFVDSGREPMAAYQLTFEATNGVVKIVGIEGGGHPEFQPAPYHDPRAIQQERVILGAFSTAAADRLPTGRTRVATIHLQTSEREEPRYRVRLEVATDNRGGRIGASASFVGKN